MAAKSVVFRPPSSPAHYILLCLKWRISLENSKNPLNFQSSKPQGIGYNADTGKSHRSCSQNRV